MTSFFDAVTLLRLSIALVQPHQLTNCAWSMLLSVCALCACVQSLTTHERFPQKVTLLLEKKGESNLLESKPCLLLRLLIVFASTFAALLILSFSII